MGGLYSRHPKQPWHTDTDVYNLNRKLLESQEAQKKLTARVALLEEENATLRNTATSTRKGAAGVLAKQAAAMRALETRDAYLTQQLELVCATAGLLYPHPTTLTPSLPHSCIPLRSP